MPSEGADTTLGPLHRRGPWIRWLTGRQLMIVLAVFVAAASTSRRASATEWPDSVSAYNNNSIRIHAASSEDDEAGPVLDVVLWFRYAGLVDTYVSARSDGEQLYLPLRELFGHLRIRCEIDDDAATARGYVTSDERPFHINFEGGTADVDGKQHHFDENEFIAEKRDVYVATALLEAWFGLAFILDAGEMALSLRAETELPITSMSRRSAQRPDLHDPYAAMRHAPLMYDRLRRNLGGGTLDYGFAWGQDAGRTFLNVDAAVGAEVLGGDLRWRAAAGRAQTPYFNLSELRWRYVRADERLSQIRVGTSHSTGLEPIAYHGIHLTNSPAEPKTYFSDYRVAGAAPPDWDVELYLDDRFVGVEKADPAGRYRFTVPIVYGTSMLRVKSYGPAGEERQDVQRIQIPFSLLAPGEMRYNVHAGRGRNNRRWMSQADVGYGIDEWLSVTAGVDLTARFEPIPVDGGGHQRRVVQAPLPYARLTSRLGTRYLAGFDASPGGYNRVSFSGFFPSHASVELQGIHFARASSLFIDGRRQMIRASGFTPFRVGRHSASLRLQAARTAYDVGSEYSIGSSVYGGFDRFRVHLVTRGAWSDGYRRVRIAPTVSYTVSSHDHDVLRYLSGMMVTARADYEVNPSRLERFHVEVAHNIRPRARLSVTLHGGLHGAPASLGFRLSTDLPAARTTTSAGMRDYGSTMTQSIRGSVVFDEPNREFHFDRRPAVGRSSAAVRLFLDEDGNGRFDVDEPVIDDDVIRLKRGSAGFKRRSGDLTLLSGLLPYARYTASVDESLLSNPMLVPTRSAFSFIADPNSVKPIDIPLSAAGVVEGRVMEMRGESVYPVPGAAVRLVRREDGAEHVLRTFSDGTFYQMGLPPGTYDIFLDERPGADLRLAPLSHTVTIQQAADGEIVEGLDFVLRHDAETRRIQVGDARRIEALER